jgi:putative hemolysin
VVSGYWTQVALVVVLVVINGALSGSEMALISLRESQIQHLERTSRNGRVLARLARDPNRFLATIQVGITSAGFLASAAAAVSLALPLIEPLSFLGAAAEPVAVIVVTLALTFITLVIGELAPKRIAMQRARRWALLAARPLDLFATAARPVVWLLGKTTDTVVRLAGADPATARAEVTPEELREVISTQHGFSSQQRAIISGAFEIAERTLRQILIPRRDVVALPTDMSTGDGLRAVIAAGHSRAPVVGPSGLDDVIGVVHIRDLLDATGPVGARARPGMFLPDTLRVSEAMRQMRQDRQQMALVVDEHGAIDGIITMEDLVEEVVGEIYDETDRDVTAVEREPDGTILLPGSFPIHDLPDIGVDIGVNIGEVSSRPYTTVAGLVLARLGHIPTTAGETVDLGVYIAEIDEVNGHAIMRLRLRPHADPSD